MHSLAVKIRDKQEVINMSETLRPTGTGDSHEEIMAYWTPERRAAATPVHITNDGPMPEPQPVEKIVPPATNEQPATDPKQADLPKMPFVTGGKLFFTMDNNDFVGSGNIFMKGNLLLTAAHCVQNKITGNMGEKFLFSRCYTGELSSEDLSFKAIAVREDWVNKKDTRYDYAIIVLNQTSTVEQPLKYTLAQDIEGKMITAMGYPAAFYGGAQMAFVKGPLSSIPGREGIWGMIGSKMSPGASGGAWVLEDNLTAIGINSFASYSPSGEQLLTGSPKFDADFESLYEYALSLM